jgi:ferredoxin
MNKIRYKLKGDTGVVELQSGTNLLDGLLDNGVRVDFSCCVGSCSRCRGVVLTGSVSNDKEDFYSLTDDELDRGMVLTCLCVVEGDMTIDFDDTY